ncbi:hypothetical protein PM035_14235 [Halorubrum ezzemoulense]|uniref:hypothetical protein n=1 Tax=Halorubrum ezzemoulense TaxID=337243 RepID=UPI00232FB374|nr:hypothetical protein [Halorubrum ezzemoulense]MDB2262131.1 hypothetical protein [Halorubrum ezzemoulense]MDB2268842.1 hypothetical protein [Halorubrum ezzemoulense]
MILIDGLSGVETLIETLLPIGTTITSIYIVALTFIFSQYEDIPSTATPGARVYFWNGLVLLVSFILAVVSTLWMLGIKLNLFSYSRQPAYVIAMSLMTLAVGTSIIGAVVIGTDLKDQLKELEQAWNRRKRDREILPSDWNWKITHNQFFQKLFFIVSMFLTFEIFLFIFFQPTNSNVFIILLGIAISGCVGYLINGQRASREILLVTLLLALWGGELIFSPLKISGLQYRVAVYFGVLFGIIVG